MRKTLSAMSLGVVMWATLFPPVPARAMDSVCSQTETGYRCLYGPIEIGFGANSFNEYVAPPPEAGYITAARATLVDEDNRPTSHHLAHLHHAWWWDPTRESLFCNLPEEPFYATGKERIRLQLPDGYGYHWSNTPRSGAPGTAVAGPRRDHGHAERPLG